MLRRALIVGSQTFGLSGVHADVSSMSAALLARGFKTDIRTESDATSEGILEGCRRLIADCGPNDPALVYYSGHGGRAANPRYQPGNRLPQILQYIVPTDHKAGSFKGILDFELSLLLGQLTSKTRNVAVILDCCHAAPMSRMLLKVRPRAIPSVWHEGVEEHLQSLRLELTGLHPESNPNAVRMVATEADKSAYEFVQEDGSYAGAMTTALLFVLKEAGEADVSWHALGMRVREIVLSHIPEQRPEVEGPSQRLLFSTNEANREGAVVFFRQEGQPFLRVGRLLGSQIGAEYGLMPSQAVAYQPGKEIARATVIAVEGNVSRVDLRILEPATELTDGALAFPLRLPFQKRNVRLLGGSPVDDQLHIAVASSPFIEFTEEDHAVIASVLASGEGLLVLDHYGAALTSRLPPNAAGINTVLRRLSDLARADALRSLANADPIGNIRVTWGRVMDGEEVPMSEGDRFHVRDHLFVRVENSGVAAVFVAVFDIGVVSNITLLTDSQPTGVKLEAGGVYRLGERAGLLIGLPAQWPADVPADGLRNQALVVIAADDWQDFRALETGTQRRGESSHPPTELERLLSQFRSGTSRDFSAETQSQAGGYLVHHIAFSLDPELRSLSGRRATFLIDETLATSYISRSLMLPEEALPRRIAIRFKDLVVHRNRALWHANIRVDTLIISGTKRGAPYSPGTYRFSRIGVEERLPFEDLLIFDGEPLHYVDLAIWVSRDKMGSKPLAELFKDVANDSDFQKAATILAGLAISVPQAAVVLGAVAAASTVGYFAAKLIDAAVGNSIGIYRTSFLPHQRFGLGLHPERGMFRAQDFSLRYDVLETD